MGGARARARVLVSFGGTLLVLGRGVGLVQRCTQRLLSKNWFPTTDIHDMPSGIWSTKPKSRPKCVGPTGAKLWKIGIGLRPIGRFDDMAIDTMKMTLSGDEVGAKWLRT